LENESEKGRERVREYESKSKNEEYGLTRNCRIIQIIYGSVDGTYVLTHPIHLCC
jgi:hypothetical protein